jgi:hypothetical protein
VTVGQKIWTQVFSSNNFSWRQQTGLEAISNFAKYLFELFEFKILKNRFHAINDSRKSKVNPKATGFSNFEPFPCGHYGINMDACPFKSMDIKFFKHILC